MTKKKPSGFTLLEVQISVTLIFLAVAGLGLLTLNGLKQLQWLEEGSIKSALVPASCSAVVTASIYSDQHAVPDKYTTAESNISVFPSSVTATVKMTSLP